MLELRFCQVGKTIYRWLLGADGATNVSSFDVRLQALQKQPESSSDVSL